MTHDNFNKGYLMPSLSKKTETDADFSGVLEVNGCQFFLKAWKAKTRDGRDYLRVRVSPRDAAV